MKMFVENHEGKTIGIDGDRPAYRVLATSGFYADNDHLYPENHVIYYDGEPNEEMEPLTPSAEEKLNAFLEKLEALGREVAAKLGRAYSGRPRNLDGALSLATAVQRAEMGLMGVKHTESTVVESADKENTPEVGTANAKRPRGRPRKDVEAA